MYILLLLVSCLLVCVACLPILFGSAYNCLFNFQSSSEDFHMRFSGTSLCPAKLYAKQDPRHAYFAPRCGASKASAGAMVGKVYATAFSSQEQC